MTLVRLTNTASVSVDLPLDHVTASATTSREHGDAQLYVPRTSAAFDPAYIADLGGFLVEIAMPGGWWRGVADRPAFDPSGCTLSLLPFSQWLDIRLLTIPRTFYAAPAGIIARQALRDGLEGLGAAIILPGTMVIAPPVLPVYQFNGQSVLSCLTDLAAFTGQEWALDNQTLSWRPQQGRYREFHIVDDGLYFASFTDGSLQDTAAEVIEVQPDGSSLTVRAGDALPFWPKQIMTRPGQ